MKKFILIYILILLSSCAKSQCCSPSRFLACKPLEYNSEADSFFVHCASDGYPVTNVAPYFYKNLYAQLIASLKLNAEWSNKSFIYFAATGDINWALRDLKNPSRKATMPSGTVTFTANQGFTFGASKYIDIGVDASTDAIMTQNSSSVGGLTITAPSNNNNCVMGCTDASLNGILARNAAYGNYYVNSPFASSPSINVSFERYSAAGWWQMTRASSSKYLRNQNGGFIYDLASTSVSKASGNIVWGALNRVGSGGVQLFSDGVEALLYGGDGTISQNFVQNIFITKFISAIGGTLYTPYILDGLGDSMMGDGITSSYSNAGIALSTVQSTLGSSWLVNNYGYNGATAYDWNNTYYVQWVSPYVNSLLTQVEWIGLGTNDLAGIASNHYTLACYNNTMGLYSKAKSLGKKIVISGISDRQGLLVGPVIYSTFNAKRDSLRTMMLSQFNISTSSPLIWKNSDGNFYVDVWYDSKFTDSTNLIYFKSDQCHRQSALDLIIAGYIVTAIGMF